jgi:hypothetical protein
MNKKDISLRKLIKDGHIGNLIPPHSINSINLTLKLDEGTVRELSYFYTDNFEIYLNGRSIVTIKITFDPNGAFSEWIELTQSYWYERIFSMSLERLSEFSRKHNIEHRIVEYYNHSLAIIFPECGLCAFFENAQKIGFLQFCFFDYSTLFSPKTVVKVSSYPQQKPTCDILEP